MNTGKKKHFRNHVVDVQLDLPHLPPVDLSPKVQNMAIWNFLRKESNKHGLTPDAVLGLDIPAELE